MRRIVITGATGTLGSAVCKALLAAGEQPVALSRAVTGAHGCLPAAVEVHGWSAPTVEPAPAAALAGADAVINLIGETVSQRWTAAAKRRIRDSRILTTRMLIAAINGLPAADRPTVLVSQSATGYYGARGEEPLTETAAAGVGFLADVVRDWEAEARTAEPMMRVVRTRTGVVLSESGGALGRMLPFFRAGVGGPIASGRQYLPWVHLADVVAALLFASTEQALDGAMNLTAPASVTSAEFARVLGRVLNRPALLPTPEIALRALFGEMAEIITTGQRAVPKRLLDADFAFRQPQLEAALRDVLK